LDLTSGFAGFSGVREKTLRKNKKVMGGKIEPSGFAS
jgi:hypothetical protein